MKRLKILLFALMLGFGLVLAQEGEGDGPEEQPQLLGMETVKLSDQGYLVDGDGLTLYLFVNDEQAASVCFDDCAVMWPPMLVGSELVAGEGVDGALLDRIERPDGTEQVTYNGWPLYYYAADLSAGNTTGQGIGDVWYVIDTEGNALEQLAE